MKAADRYHRWVEWSEDEQVYFGKCPDLITGIHGDDPVEISRDLCETIEDVIRHHNETGRALTRSAEPPVSEATLNGA